MNFAAECTTPTRSSTPALLPDERARHPDDCARPPGASARALRRFHHVSTCEVYGDLALDATEPFTEDVARTRPRTPYNASKAGGDHAVRAYHETYGLPSRSPTAPTTTALPVPGEGHPALHHPAARRPAASPLRSTANRREWIHVDDHCRADPRGPRRRPRRRDLQRGDGRRGAASSRSPTPCSPRSGKPASLKTIVPDRPGHDRRYLLDSPRSRASSAGSRQRSTSTTALRGDRRLVRGEPLVVGAALRPAPVDERSPGSDLNVRVLVTGAGRPGRPRARRGVRAAHEVIGRRPRRPRRRRPRRRARGDHHARARRDRALRGVDGRRRLRGAIPTARSRVNALGVRTSTEAARRVGAVRRDAVDRLRVRRRRSRAVRRVGHAQPASVYGAVQAGGELEIDPECARRAHVVGVRAPRRQHGRRPSCGSRAEHGTLRFVDDQRGCPTFAADLAVDAARLVVERLPGHVARHQPGRGQLVRVRPATCCAPPATIPPASRRSRPPISTRPRPAPRPGELGARQPRRCAWPGRPLAPRLPGITAPRSCGPFASESGVRFASGACRRGICSPARARPGSSRRSRPRRGRHDDRVQVHLGDLGQLLGERADAQR